LSLQLIYVGCEGVLIRSARGSVLIDGLFGPEAEAFHVPPVADLEALRAARPPFDGVDLILATHWHEDHLDPAAVASYLAASPATRFMSTPQAVERLRAHAGDVFDHRVTQLAPAEGERRRIDAGGIVVEWFGLSHGKVNYADVQNLGLIVRLDGRSVIHLGDGIIDEKSFRAAGVLDETIDVGVLPFWFLTYPYGKKLVQKAFRPRALFAVHIRVRERDDVTRAIAEWIDATPLVEPLARYRIDDDGLVTREDSTS
jgi:L-ascorbate metabolism protein UlaG (beta-lactamase superfamily)